MAKIESSMKSDIPTSIGAPARRALHNAGFVHLEQFTKVKMDEVLKLHGVGPKAFDIIQRSLNEKGLTFANGFENK